MDTWLAKSRVRRCITVRMSRRGLRDVDTRCDHDSGRTRQNLSRRSSPGERYPL